MSQDVYIFEVNDRNFPSVVVENSRKVPVVVEFMGVWSEPCFAVAEIFSALAKEFPAQFIFAKVDIDESPELRKEYQIENVPTTGQARQWLTNAVVQNSKSKLGRF